jgi:hypothetical protein
MASGVLGIELVPFAFFHFSLFRAFPTAVRLKVEENQLVDVFGEICVRVDGLKSA